MDDNTTMPVSAAERKIRAQLRFFRLLQTYMPLRAAGWLNKQASTRVRLPAGVKRESISADGVPCEWLIPKNSPANQVLLYLHGGGFVFGLTSLHLKMVACLTQQMGVRALMVDYRLGPVHPFPAALEDCLTVYRWLRKQGIAARDIVIAGDSAGGNLTITTMMKLRDEGEELPAATACLSPVANLSERVQPADGFKDPLIPPKAARLYNTSYVAQSDPRNPLISPVFGDWHSLPPLLVHAGEEEMLRQDALQIEELAKSAGVEVRVEIYPRMWHVWQLYLTLPQAAQSLGDIARFLKSHLQPGVA